MKKALSLILAISLIFCALPVMGISAEETASDKFSITTGKSPTITGDDLNGYTMVLPGGTWTTRIMTKETYPIQNLSFEYGCYREQPGNAYGKFGITVAEDADSIPNMSVNNTLSFTYRAAQGDNNNTRLDIYVIWNDNDGEHLIGSFDYPTYRPGDDYRNANVSNFQLVKDSEGKIRLAVDGNLCTLTDYSNLSIVFSNALFNENAKVHIFVGGITAAGNCKVYFKQQSALSEDGAWESRAVNRYVYSAGGVSYEQRCGGITTATVTSAIPTTAIGSKDEGHLVDFTGTNGYAQTTEGFDLKTTTFKVLPITSNGNTNNIYYYLGFTTNPSKFKYYSVKPSNEIIEFVLWDVNNNRTIGFVNKTESANLTSTFTHDPLMSKAMYRSSGVDYASYNPIKISFVNDLGVDGTNHWYIKFVAPDGNTKILKGANAADDLYYQFDNIIDKPVYFRMGTNGKETNTLKMFCDIDNTADGSTAWDLPALSDDETTLVSEVKAGITELGDITADTVAENYEAGLALIAKYDSLSADALKHLTDAEKTTFAAIREVVEAYTPSVFDVNSAKVDSTTITGNEVDGYTMKLAGGQTRVVSKASYPIQNLSFDFGFNYTQYAANKGYGEFGITTRSVDELIGKSGPETLTFFYYVNQDNKGSTLNIYVKWSNDQSRLIGSFPFATYRPADGYWGPNISNFSFVKVDGHWHLAVDGNVCNRDDGVDSFAHSCLEYDGREAFFEDNTNVHIYVGAYDGSGVGGTAYLKPLTVASDDGIWESTAVDSYVFTENGVKKEYRGQGNTTSTVHSAIPSKAESTDNGGHIVDFTGTNGYAQTANGYDLKTTKFHVTPKTTATVDSSTNNEFSYYIGFTSDPSNIQYHSVKPGDSIEFHAWSVNSDGTTYGKVITNKGCLATPSEEWGAGQRLCNFRTLNSEGFVIDFVKDTGADGELHWYMRTSIGGVSIIAKGTADNDTYFQFDNIIDKPVYFRMGTHTMTTTNFTMSCKIDGDVITDSALYTDIISEDYLVDYEDGAVIDGAEYAYCDTIGEVGEYSIEYTASGIKRVRKLVLYKASDVNADNEIDIRDLVALKKNIVGMRELDIVGTKAADMTGDSKIDALDLTEVRKGLLNGFFR